MVSGGCPAMRMDQNEMTQGTECLYRVRNLDMDPGGVCTLCDPLHHETLSLAATVTLGKMNPVEKVSH